MDRKKYNGKQRLHSDMFEYGSSPSFYILYFLSLKTNFNYIHNFKN